MAAQKLFSDFPTQTWPGSVTPNMTADIQQSGDIQDQIAAYNFAKQKKADREAEWARAAAANRMRQAVGQIYGGGGGHYLPSTMKQSNPRAYEQFGPAGQSGIRIGGGAYQGPIKYAPSGMTGGALGLWAEQEDKRAMRENRRPSLLLQRYADNPSVGSKGFRYR